MPEIVRFYGLIIKMFFGREHNPPHFHVLYGEYMGEIDIRTLEIIQGDLPVRALSLVKEWASIHKDELLEMWNTKKLRKLAPLK